MTRASLSGGLLLFFSGAAALVFQLLWVKQLSLIVGVDVYAITTAVSAFFAGLAIGSGLFGRAADSWPKPLRLYAWLELAAAVTSVLATLTLARSAAPFAALNATAGPLAWILPFAIVGLPATFMGGTLPVVVRFAKSPADDVAIAGGALYAANTAGAVAGVVLTTLILIPSLGVRGSAFAAAVVQIALAATALVLSSANQQPGTNNQQPIDNEQPWTNNQPRTHNQLALALYAFSGGLALGYEVVWSQVLVQFTSTRAFAFAVVLAMYLIGLACGSALYARIAAKRDPWLAFGVLIAGAGFLALALVAGLGGSIMKLQSEVEELLRQSTGSELAAMLGRFVVAAIAVVLPPTIALGAAFPAAIRLAGGGRPGRDVGALLAWNTIGGVAGTLIVGFLIVPAIGLIHTLALLAMAAASIGIFALGRMRPDRGGRAAILAIAAGTLVMAAVTPSDHLARLLSLSRGGELAYYSEDAGGTVAVLTQRGPRPFQRLYIQGVSNSGDAMPSLRYMRLQALLPLIIHAGEPRSALVIGFGTGITAGAVTRYPGLERQVCAELMPAVVGAAPLFNGNFGVGRDGPLTVRFRDGRRELLSVTDRYDLITLEPPPPAAAGVVNLYSRDFYQLASERLQLNGIVAQWWPLATQNDEDSRALVRSFLDVFPYASLWTTELHEMLLVGSVHPIELDPNRIYERFSQPGVRSALGEVGVGSPAALLATWITDKRGLERYAAGARAVTDDWPSIEYATWVRRGEFGRVLPSVLELQTPPPLVSPDDELIVEVNRQREILMNFYHSGLAAYKGDRDGWRRALDAAMRADPGNAYFNWIAGSAEF